MTHHRSSGQTVLIALLAILVFAGATLLLLHFATNSAKKKEEARQEEKVRREKEVADRKATSRPVTPPEYPRSGEGYATKDVGVKAYIDPLRTTTRPTGRVRFVFVKDPAVTFDDLAGIEVERDSKRERAWRDMPAGEYVVYSLENRKIWFKWWM